jgi:uncharacterized protein (TIGR00369 family)
MADTRVPTRQLHDRTLAQGEHVFSSLNFREVPAAGVDLAVELEVTPRVSNGRGTLQGGLIATLVDVAAGLATVRTLPEGHDTTTSDLSVHYLRPVTTGPARAEATVVRRGRRRIVLRVEVLDGEGELAAVSTISFAVLPPR